MSSRSLLSLVTLCALLAGCRAGDGPAAAASRAVRIAVVPFAVMPGSPAPPIDVAAAIRADLAARGRVAATDVAAMPARPSTPAAIDFGHWRDVDYVVVGRVAMVHDGGHELEFEVVDAAARTTLFGFQLASAPDELPHTAREIAALVHERISG